MNFAAYSKHDDGFAIQNFRAEFRWKTSSSISFMLCYRSAPNVVQGFGWLDVHETTDEWRRIKIRICLYQNYLLFEDCENVVKTICEQLSLPNDSYEATFISPLKQISFETGCDHEFVSYGPPFEPDDNPWDDRDGVSPLEVISRASAFGMLLNAFPEFHKRLDGEKQFGLSGLFGEHFLDCSETFVLVDAVESIVRQKDESQLRRLFDVLEKLVVYGDDYTRNASLTRIFELFQGNEFLAKNLKSYLLPKHSKNGTKLLSK